MFKESNAATPSGPDDPPAILPTRHGLHETGKLIDQYGRHITYVRLSVTDRCDFRCTYCMSENMTFLPRDQVLSLEESLSIASAFVGLGVSKIRVTGGEPLVRRNILWLLERLAALPGLRELVLTTNGSQLERFAADLKRAGIKRLNISLDTLDAARFQAITRIGDLHKVLRGIDAAQQAGFERIKLNSVLLRETYAEESLRLVRFAIERGLDIAFIEEMPLGDIGNRLSHFVSNEETLAHLTRHFQLTSTRETTGGPARYWRIEGSNSRIGLISPHSHNFCADCNRVRITAQGELYPCLGQNDVIPLMPLLRQHNGNEQARNEAVAAAIISGMKIKAQSHDFGTQMDTPQVVRFMSTTGG